MGPQGAPAMLPPHPRPHWLSTPKQQLERRGSAAERAMFVQACLPEQRRVDVCLPLPAAPRAQPLPGVSSSADDVSIWGPPLSVWKLFAGFAVALGFETPTTEAWPPGGGSPPLQSWGRGDQHRHCWGAGLAHKAPSGAGHPWFPSSFFIASFLPSFPAHSFIHSFGVEHQSWARPSAGLWALRAAVVLSSGSYRWEVGLNCNQSLGSEGEEADLSGNWVWGASGAWDWARGCLSQGHAGGAGAGEEERQE